MTIAAGHYFRVERGIGSCGNTEHDYALATKTVVPETENLHPKSRLYAIAQWIRGQPKPVSELGPIPFQRDEVAWASPGTCVLVQFATAIPNSRSSQSCARKRHTWNREGSSGCRRACEETYLIVALRTEGWSRLCSVLYRTMQALDGGSHQDFHSFSARQRRMFCAIRTR